MRCLVVMLFTTLLAGAAFAQAAPPAAQVPNPASAPRPGVVPPRQPNPAMAPQPPAPTGTAGRGMPPVEPADGVTPDVRRANTHGVDAEGHALDPHGKPVGQAPAPASTR